MERCLEKQNSQALRLLNNTGISSIPLPSLDGSDNELYNELLHNASILYNETLVTCNKTEFLTVRGNIREHYKNFIVLSTEGFSFEVGKVIARVRYINILTRLRGFRVKIVEVC